MQENNKSLKEDLEKLRQEKEAQTSEVESLRSRSNLSQQNWIKERDELISREAYAREEFENAKQAMQDWEVLAMNERSLRENLAEKDSELREQLETFKEQYEKASRDRDTNNQAVEGLQKALQEVQTCNLPPLNLQLHLLTAYSAKSGAEEVRRSLRIPARRPPQTSPSCRRCLKRCQSDCRVYTKGARTRHPL